MGKLLRASALPLVLGFILSCSAEHTPGDGSLGSFTADPVLQQQAITVLNTHCGSCHGSQPGQGGIHSITNIDHLIKSGLMVPGDSTQGRLVGSMEDGSMPDGTSMPAADIQAVIDWIDSASISSDQLPQKIPLEATWTSIYANILQPKCNSCHRTGGERPSERYTSYNEAKSTGKITAGNPNGSGMYIEILNETMPEAPYAPLTFEEKEVVRLWILEGAQNN